MDCPVCQSSYGVLYNLRKHIKAKHPEQDLDSIAPTLTSQRKYKFVCELCEKHFTSENKLKSHVKLKHFANDARTNKNDWATSQHSNFHEFLLWKKKMENETKTYYQKYGCIQSGNKVIHYFSCHRSGYFVTRGKRLRRMKSQGSCKINGICPAKIKASVINDKKVFVSVYLHHQGHSNDLQDLKLGEEEKLELSKQIADGIPLNNILDKVCSLLESRNLEQTHLLMTKDLENIVRQYNMEVHDNTSVDSFVLEMKEKEDNCVVFYKTQGVLDTNYPVFEEEDFVLCIMNNAQMKILQQYGQDCICIDSTQGTNQYDFNLTTLIVLDEHKQGFPCAFILSLKIDTPTLSTCFKQIRKRTGLIHCNVFMSDMAPAVYNSWISAMDEPEKRLFCSWLVDKAWRTNIEKVVGTEKQYLVYKHIKMINMLLDQDEFENMYECFIDDLVKDKDCIEFGIYLSEYFSNNTEYWAYCFRQHSGIDTNMHLESMHRIIEYLYFCGKNGWRLDKTIGTLMTFIRDKLFEQVITLHKGKVSAKLQEIRSSHSKSLSKHFEVLALEDGEWQVKEKSRTYIVRKTGVTCNCKLVCAHCKICIHDFFCTCHNSTIEWNICKHIHSIVQNQMCSQNIHHHTRNVDVNTRVSSLPIASDSTTNTTTNVTVNLVKEACIKEFLTLLNMAKSPEEITVIKKGVANIRATLTRVCQKRSETNLSVARSSNKRNISPQPRLHSTKQQKFRHHGLEAFGSTPPHEDHEY